MRGCPALRYGVVEAGGHGGDAGPGGHDHKRVGEEEGGLVRAQFVYATRHSSSGTPPVVISGMWPCAYTGDSEKMCTMVVPWCSGFDLFSQLADPLFKLLCMPLQLTL